METIINKAQTDIGVSEQTLLAAIEQSIMPYSSRLKKVLILPPDYTRSHSEAGKITFMYYNLLKDSCEIDIMPALGTHLPMSREERIAMFGLEIPDKCFIVHNWRNDVVKIGEVPSEYVHSVSKGLVDYPIEVEINKRLLYPSYDLIISVGQVVPHEVVGMANYSKNILVGCGGSNFIHKSHMLGAIYGMERIMGRDLTPVRQVFDYSQQKYLSKIPLLYVLTVTTQKQNGTCIEGLFIGDSREVFEEAVVLSQQKNLTFVDKPFQKVIVYLDDREFKSTWLGNKAIYRTRMAIADGGDLIILAPGVRQFGEDIEIDGLIRKYGYVGRKRVIEALNNDDLRSNLSAAAHLIHGSSDGRFTITYCPGGLSKEEVEGVNFNYMDLSKAYKLYDPSRLKDGWNTLESGEQIFYISNPALGLWADRKKF